MQTPQSDEGSLAPPTRARIFAFLAGLGSPTGTEELAQHFDLHPNGVRRHLERLEADRLVERGREKPLKGRPRDIWSVVPGVSPDGERPRAYEDLARWLTRAVPRSSARLNEVEQIGDDVGRELIATTRGEPVESFRDVVAAMGFAPTIERRADGFTCRLGNCPYRDSAQEAPDVVCRLHRGITAGILAGIDSQAELTLFEPHDPEDAGCVIEVKMANLN